MLFYFVRKILFSENAGSIVRGIAYLCTGGIAMSVFATVIVISIMLGLNDSIHDRTLAVEPYFEIPAQKEASAQAYAQNLRALLNSKFELQVYVADKQDLLIRTVDGLSNGAVGIGFETGEWDWVWDKIKDKNNFEDTPVLSENEVAVGIDLARDLAIYEGDEIVIFSPESMLVAGSERPEYQKVRVAKIIRSDSPEHDARSIYYDAFLGLSRLGSEASLQRKIHIRLANKEEYLPVKSFLDAQNIKYQTWEDKNEALLFALKMEKSAMSLFLLFTVLIASFSIFTVLSLVISQKRKDIGLLQAYGMSAKRVRRLFTGVGMSLSTFGVLLGGILAIALALVLQKFQILHLPEDIYYDHKVPIRIDWFFIASVMISALVVAYVGSFIPAYFSVRESIVDLIRGRSSS